MFKNNYNPPKAIPRKQVTVSILNLDAGERAREFGLDYEAAQMFLEGYTFKLNPETGLWSR